MRCEHCGKEITKDVRKGRRFCNQRCFGEWQSQNIKGVDHPTCKQVERTCESCGKTFAAKQSEVAKGWARFCSQKCHYAAGRVECVCQQCGGAFTCRKNQVERFDGGGKFCCRSCRHQWQREHPPERTPPVLRKENHPNWNSIETQCAYCHIVLRVPPSTYHTRKHCFCDNVCYGKWYSETMSGENAPNWLGGTKKWRGKTWKRQRHLALERDKHTCQYCETKRKTMQVHHIVPFREFGLEREAEANNLLNLITLCPSCHMKAENGLIPLSPRLL